MRPEQRAGSSSRITGSTGDRRKSVTGAKPFTIPKRLVYEAFKAVKANAGSAGVDQETIEDFEKELERQSVPDLEPDVVGKLLPAACQGGGHSEEEWRGKDSRRPNRGGSRGADGRQNNP